MTNLRTAGKRGDALGLTRDEVAFYDALSANDSAVDVVGDLQLRAIADEVTATVRNTTIIDWTVRETARANLRRRVQREHGYPPNRQDAATDLAIEQAESIGAEWAAWRSDGVMGTRLPGDRPRASNPPRHTSPLALCAGRGAGDEGRSGLGGEGQCSADGECTLIPYRRCSVLGGRENESGWPRSRSSRDADCSSSAAICSRCRCRASVMASSTARVSSSSAVR